MAEKSSQADRSRKKDSDRERKTSSQSTAKKAKPAMASQETSRKADTDQQSPARPARDMQNKNRKAATPPPEEHSSLFDRLTDLTSSAYRFAKRTTDGGIRVGRALIKSQDQLKVMLAAGQSLRDLREVAGLTISELSDALNLRDKSLLEAVEDGTATLSFELILRLSALLARNDPIPFILRFTRTYNPELWKILHDWGLGRIPLQYERERQFINIYRRRDAARQLSDEGFQHVLKFTQEAFEMALHFVAEQEQIAADEELPPEDAVAEELRRQAKEQKREGRASDEPA